MIDERRLKDMTCPQCGKPFVLKWADWDLQRDERQTLVIRGCPSGGIYDVLIRCAFCDYEEPL